MSRDKIELENLRDGEEIELILRRHWIVFWLIKIYAGFWILVSLALFFILWFSPISLILNILFWMLFGQYLVIAWMNHELDLMVVTNNRIICIEQVSFLNRFVGECNLGQVQEISSQTKWVFSNIFNYGNIVVKTAGNSNNFDMIYCPDVMKNTRNMLNIVDHYRDTHANANSIVAEENVIG